jgi:hypothetical protein
MAKAKQQFLNVFQLCFEDLPAVIMGCDVL